MIRSDDVNLMNPIEVNSKNGGMANMSIGYQTLINNGKDNSIDQPLSQDNAGLTHGILSNAFSENDDI